VTTSRILGLAPDYVPYEAALDVQRETHRRVSAGEQADTLLLLEHEFVYTAGKRTEASEWPTDGSKCIPVDRGGKLTWHGPGQLIGYPILTLPEPIDVVAYVRRLEDLLIDVVRELGVPGVRIAGRSGVWVERRDEHGEVIGSDKIAAIGIRVAEGVTMHGFALNCSHGLEPYDVIVACGIRDAGITTLSRETGRLIAPADVVPLVLERFDRFVVDPVAPASAAAAVATPPVAPARPLSASADAASARTDERQEAAA